MLDEILALHPMDAVFISSSRSHVVSFLLAAETDEPMMRPDIYLELGADGQRSVMKPGTIWTGQRLECRAGHSDASHPVSTRCITTL